MSLAFTNQTSFKPIGTSQRQAVDTAITITIPGEANGVIVSAEGQPLRITLDGSVASASNGLPLAINTPTRLDMYSRARIGCIGMNPGSFMNYQFISIT